MDYFAGIPRIHSSSDWVTQRNGIARLPKNLRQLKVNEKFQYHRNFFAPFPLDIANWEGNS